MANQPDEIKTAESSEDLSKATGDTVITDRHGGPKQEQQLEAATVTHKRGKGFGTTNFDGVAPPPHLRAKVNEEGHAEKNKKLLEDHKAKNVEAQKK